MKRNQPKRNLPKQKNVENGVNETIKDNESKGGEQHVRENTRTSENMSEKVRQNARKNVQERK